MEDWEMIVESYPEAPDLRVFSKMLKTAEISLNGDLASFESDWILSTLFFKPVNLLETVTSNCQDVQWNRSICDAFKLISHIVEKYQPEHLYENIVTLCSLPYTAQIRSAALHCMSAVAVHSTLAARDWRRLVSELEEGVTGKAPLAALVGTIMEHHPEVVTDVHFIWRIFLNLLDSNKNTDTVISAVFKALCSLFKHFGQDLPIIEFRDLYGQISKDYIMKKGCVKACLSMLEQYSDLFKELLSKDLPLREYLWGMQESTALMSVYRALATAVNKEKLQQIIDTELTPRTKSSNSNIKYTSLRIVRELMTKHGVTGEIDGHADVQTLEHELKAGNISFDVANAILWCIESNALYSDRLLQTAILFYTNIPSSKRKDIVVYGLLNAPEDVRRAAVTLLISESCQLTEGSHNIDKYLPLWTDLLDSSGGKDTVVVERGGLVIDDVMEYLYTVVEAVLCEECEKLPEKLSPLLTLTYHILTIHPPEDYTERHCKKLLRLLYDCMDCNVTAPLLSAVTAASKHSGEKLTDFCKKVRVDKCSDEATLCECCYMLIQDEAEIDVGDVLEALEILFSRSDVDPRILIQALKRFQDIISKNDDVDSEKVDYIIHLIDNLRTLKNKSSKEARVLHRDVIIFLGKYGNENYIAEKSEENIVIAKLKDKLLLNIPNTEDGTTYKLNVQRLLQLAIIYEEPDALQKLLAMIFVTLSTKQEDDLQLSLASVITALCRAHAHTARVDVTAVNSAVLLCRTVDCVCALLTAIKTEKSPGARKMIADALEGALITDLGSETTELLVQTVADEAAAMMDSNDATTRSGGLNVTETLLTALKDNHTLQRTILPNLLPLILETNDFDAKSTFQNATKILLDNLEIYENSIIKKMVKKLIRNIVENCCLNNDIEVKLFKTKVVETACFLVDVKLFDDDLLKMCVEKLDDGFSKVLFFMGEYKIDLNLKVIGEILKKIVDLRFEEGIEDDFIIEAVLKILQEYCDVLFEKNAEMTIKSFGAIITNIHPHSILHLYKQLMTCIPILTKHIKPSKLQEFYKNWCLKFNINNSINDFTTENLYTENMNTVKALKIYTDLLHITVYDENMSNICHKILDIYVKKEEKYLDTYKEYLTNLLYMSLKSHTITSIKKFIVITHERTKLDFLRYFVVVFSEYFLAKPYILLDEEMSPITLVFKYILMETLKKKYDDDYYKNLLELIDVIWHTFEPLSTFDEKCHVLSLISRLPMQLQPTSRPIQWAIKESTVGTKIEDKIRLVAVLPGGEECSTAYRSLASHLPVRLSELTGIQHGALQVLLDALASTGDLAVLDIAANLAHCDPTKGWWDGALASSVASLASGDCLKHTQETIVKEEDNGVLLSIANTLFEKPSLGVCHRLLIPLLRYSSPSFCEQFYSGVIYRLLSSLNSWPREPSRGLAEYERILKEHARALALLTVAFEKVPLASLKSADSVLYAQVKDKQPSYLIKRACTLCYVLRNKVIPDDATAEVKSCYRQSLVENYRCFCAAVCVSRPAEKHYGHLFDARVWHNIVDQDAKYELPVLSQWNQSRTFRTTAANIPAEGTKNHGSAGTRTGTLHTRVFLRTLSVDPLQYDLLEVGEQEDNAQELELSVNELNSQDCIVPLTALVKHAASLTHYNWRKTIAETLVGDAHTNLKWTLAQVICNCKEDLITHSGSLRPALLQMVADTPRDSDGKRTLNGLHVDVLETVLYWQDSPLPESSYPHLATTIEYLINTAIENGHRTSVFNSLLSMLGKMAELYGQRELPWQGFENYLADTRTHKYLLSVLLNITKHKIRIPNLLPTLTQLDHKLWTENIRLSEIFGYALSCESERAVYLSQHRKFLVRKTSGVDFVKLVYNVQKGYPQFVDEGIFKTIADLTPKLVGHSKSWCLKILASYVEHASHSSSCITDMLDTVDICSLLQDNTVEALAIVKQACRWMGDRLKRRVVALVAGQCENMDGKIRKAAMEVALKIFEDLFKPKDSEPPYKRRKLENTTISSSNILREGQSPDTERVIECVARGVTDCDENIAVTMREGVAECLNTSDMGIRLSECYLIAVTIPATQRHSDASLCAAAFLDMLFKDLRSNARFKAVKLSEAPLEIRNSTSGPSKLLTNSRTYHGTFLSVTSRKMKKIKEPTSNGINVQIPIDEILGTFIQFAKEMPDVAQALCLQVVKTILLHPSPGFDARASLSRLVGDILSSTPSCLTPLAIQTARIIVDTLSSTPGFHNSLDKLRLVTRCTEGEAITTLLWEDVLLRTGDETMFYLGCVKYDDVSMNVELTEPSLDAMMSAFGKLSNWDKLTIQAKEEIKNSGLPQLWVDSGTFKRWLDAYEVTNTSSWFNKLVVTYRDESKQDGLRWLRETDIWPRNHFHVSTVTECLQMSSECEEIKLPGNIRPTDCLVEWAARIMIRKAYATCHDDSSDGLAPPGDQELSWCRIANDTQLPYLALNCFERSGHNPPRGTNADFKAYATCHDDSSDGLAPPGDQELSWCRIANDRQLPYLALNCYERSGHNPPRGLNTDCKAYATCHDDSSDGLAPPGDQELSWCRIANDSQLPYLALNRLKRSGHNPPRGPNADCKAYATCHDDSSDGLAPPGDQELSWCRIANDRQLPYLALNCYERSGHNPPRGPNADCKAYATCHDDSSDGLAPPGDQELSWCRIANERQLPHLALNCFERSGHNPPRGPNADCKAYATCHDDSSDGLAPPGDQELSWCRIANDRQLGYLALNCYDAHASALDPSQVLSWSIEKARALRTIGLDTHNIETMERSLGVVEGATIRVDSSDSDVIALNQLLMTLQKERESLGDDIIEYVLDVIQSHTERRNMNKKNKQAMCSVYEFAMDFYDESWSKGHLKCGLLSDMADILGRVIDLDLGIKTQMFLAVILNRLEDMEELSEDASRKILEKISLLIENLDEFSLEVIRDRVNLFPSEVLNEFSNITDAVNRSEQEEIHKRRLQLICDPRYSLSLRCAKLLQINDLSEWAAVFKLMKDNIFENPYAATSTEYNLLAKYKNDLYQIEDFETTDRSQRTTILNKVLKDLSEKVSDRKTLRLSQLCPSLMHREEVGSESDRCLSRLLRLGKLSVVKFYEQVSVFTNAITRPVVMKFLLSDGTTRKFITKSGERLKVDAAAHTAAVSAAVVCTTEFHGYTVTPLGEDSGLIEYLEDNITFRDLVTNVHDLDEMTRRLSRFIVSSSPLEKFKTYCNQIPAYTLRSAVENNCSSVEDFINKKQHFLETYSFLTLLGSIFGLGDRHLENLLYLRGNGTACCVDWANALQYGRGEIPPARLTRNILGLVDGQALEARLQNMLSALRGSHRLYSNVVKLVFKWMGEEFLDKFNYITLFLRGEATTYDITEMSLTTSEDSHRYKDQLNVLRDIFKGETKENYSVVEQVNCLLKQCTHPRILSTTREGWEAYI